MNMGYLFACKLFPHPTYVYMKDHVNIRAGITVTSQSKEIINVFLCTISKSTVFINKILQGCITIINVLDWCFWRALCMFTSSNSELGY
jgi:hypothetical protein